jgi:hypothetical protein
MCVFGSNSMCGKIEFKLLKYDRTSLRRRQRVGESRTKSRTVEQKSNCPNFALSSSGRPPKHEPLPPRRQPTAVEHATYASTGATFGTPTVQSVQVRTVRQTTRVCLSCHLPSQARCNNFFFSILPSSKRKGRLRPMKPQLPNHKRTKNLFRHQEKSSDPCFRHPDCFVDCLSSPSSAALC